MCMPCMRTDGEPIRGRDQLKIFESLRPYMEDTLKSHRSTRHHGTLGDGQKRQRRLGQSPSGTE